MDTAGIPATSHPLAADTAWREDVPQPSLPTADALANAPDANRDAGLFRCPEGHRISGTIRSAVEAALARIDATQPVLQAFQHVAAERALERADALDRADTPAGPFAGVPLALKDNIVARGLPTSAGSKKSSRGIAGRYERDGGRTP